MKIMTYEEWCEYVWPKVYLNGRLFHNFGFKPFGSGHKFYVEDWATAERIWSPMVSPSGQQNKRNVFKFENGESWEIDFSIPIDPRYNYTQNRERLEIKPEYEAVGAKNWDECVYFKSKYNNPPPPL